MTYIQPLLLVFLVIAALGLMRRRSRGNGVVAIGLAGIFLLSWPPVDWLLSRPLEAPYTQNRPALDSAQSIVVLAASVTPPRDGIPYAVPDNDTYERSAMAAWLHTHGHPLPILACGGVGSPGKEPFSETMRRILQGLAVPNSMIWTETQSTSTHENATYGAEILKARGVHTIVLVTEAKDMLRAERCFRKEGLTVIPYPIAFRHLRSTSDELIPGSRAIDRNERTLHETVGLVWYWLRGWI